MVASDVLGIASRFALAGDEPVRLVVHHRDGTWDFLCNTTSASADVVTVRAAEVFARFADFAELADLPRGYLAEREEPATPGTGNWTSISDDCR